jgi:hypothetical protein
LIFNRLNFHGHLRLSSVCRRFLEVIENDVKFMRTVNFRAVQIAMRKHTNTIHGKLMRAYRTVTLWHYKNVVDLTDLEQAMLKDVESLNLCTCSFRDTAELVSVLKHCKHLKTVLFNSRRIKNLTANPPKETYSSPVSIVIDIPVCQALNCFTNISQIHVRDWNYWETQDISRFLSEYSAIVSSMDIYERDSDDYLQLLVQKPELKLKHINMFFYDPKHVEPKAQLFAHQRTYLTSLAARGFMNQQLFDAIHSNLVNLEALDLQIKYPKNVRLNDLKVLTKLKSLTVSFREFQDENDLDISGLVSLEQLKLSISLLRRPFKLVLKQPLLKLKKLELRFPVDKQLFGQMATMFPNLRNLELRFYVSMSIPIEVNELKFLTVQSSFFSTATRTSLPI